MGRFFKKNYPVVTNIIRLAEEKNMSVDQLSQYSGIIVEDLIKILDNRKMIRPAQIAAAALALHVDVNALFEKPEND